MFHATGDATVAIYFPAIQMRKTEEVKTVGGHVNAKQNEEQQTEIEDQDQSHCNC